MEHTYKKTDAGTLEVTSTPVELTTTTFTYDYLIKQRDAIQAQKKRDSDQRDAELHIVNEHLAKCDELDIV